MAIGPTGGLSCSVSSSDVPLFRNSQDNASYSVALNTATAAQSVFSRPAHNTGVPSCPTMTDFNFTSTGTISHSLSLGAGSISASSSSSSTSLLSQRQFSLLPLPSSLVTSHAPDPLPQTKILQRTQPYFKIQEKINRPEIPDRVFEILFSNKRKIVYGNQSSGTIDLPLLDTKTNTVSFSVESKFKITTDVPYESVKPRFDTNERVLVFDNNDKNFYIGYYVKLDKQYHIISKKKNSEDLEYIIEIATNPRTSGILIEKIIPFPPGTEKKLAKAGYVLQNKRDTPYYDFSKSSAAAASQSGNLSNKRRRSALHADTQKSSSGRNGESSSQLTHDLSSFYPSASSSTSQPQATSNTSEQLQYIQAVQSYPHISNLFSILNMSASNSSSFSTVSLFQQLNTFSQSSAHFGLAPYTYGAAGPAPQGQIHPFGPSPLPPASLDTSVSSAPGPAPQAQTHSFGALPLPPASLDTPVSSAPGPAPQGPTFPFGLLPQPPEHFSSGPSAFSSNQLPYPFF